MKINQIAKLTTAAAVLGSAMLLSGQNAQPKPNVKPNLMVPAKAAPASPTTPSTPAKVNVVQYPLVSCSQSHPGESERTKDVFEKGDSHMSKAVAAHVVNYAIQRFQLTAFVQPEDIERARSEVYEHLKWKLGNPPAIAGQFVTAGYQHFDNAFVYEAAAALVNYQLPGEKNGPDWKIPKKWADTLHKAAEADGKRLDAYLEKNLMFPHDEAYKISAELTGAANNAIENIGMNIPKNWNIDHNSVLGMIATAKAAGGSAGAAVAREATLR